MLRVNSADLQPARVLLATLVVSCTAALLKFLVAWETASLALLADAAYSLLAVTASLAGLLAVWGEDSGEERVQLKQERKRQTLVMMLLSTVLALTAWEILGAAFHRWQVPLAEGPALLLPLGGLALAGVAHVIWWALVRQGSASPLMNLSIEAAALQMVTTGLAVFSLLIASVPAWTRWDAGLAVVILLILARTTFRMVEASLTALIEG
jgi:divalent metal cation (Fe/Co/Zn/Cd) transporter